MEDSQSRSPLILQLSVPGPSSALSIINNNILPIMFCFMDPPIENSIIRVKEDCWMLGSEYSCEVVVSMPDDAVTSWEADGNTYCIRKSSNRSNVSGDPESDRVHKGGTAAAVWRIGGTFIKVKSWLQGMQLESDIIRFVNSTSSVTTPEILCTWVDVEWNRTFLVLKAMEGQTLDEAWDSLSADQHMQIAGTVAQLCKTLASSTSEKLMSASGGPIAEPFLTVTPPHSKPSWKPHIYGPWSQNDLQSLFSGSDVLEGHTKFHFYHADLGPTNIMVRKDGSVVGIIDWESAAFYPRFWLGTKPLVSAGFYLSGEKDKKRNWAVMLSDALGREGFPSDVGKYKAWSKAVRS
ncbi:hypothetical protein CC80DRAFT_532103 [Byssothecium circinans]|uniref:Aminoglycoside phosphotransferase domain-containing protein n=1 Tax=Byssothecium circinans TaxID=147558 RepID=A0A6A5U9U5_9PLEO|nr:hypothetical protein CC80DRAFT_532103 [Byssothecium circinans]